MFRSLPNFYPDESVISLLARFRHRLMFFDTSFVYSQVFNQQVVLRHDLPAHLEPLVNALPANTLYNADYIINEHTLFPYYRPFVTLERQQRTRKAMSANNSRGPILTMGLANGNVPIIQRLRFCPGCFADDYQRYEERYWHRLHQISGVEVCPKHKVFLEQSSAIIHTPRIRQRLASADEFAQESHDTGRPIDENNSDHLLLLNLANDVSWLLGQTELTDGPEAIAIRYSRLLTERGFASHSGAIYVDKVLTAFSEHYSPELLSLLGCELVNNKVGSWPRLVLRGPAYMQNPIRYLLLMRFLGHSAESFFSLPGTRTEPFVDMRWPCLNPVCKHYRKLVINGGVIGPSTAPTRQLQATVACKCGFTYRCLITDTEKGKGNREFQARSVVSYGPLWERAFIEMWQNSAIPQAKVADALGFRSRDALRKHAARLGLPLTRSSSTSQSVKEPRAPHKPGRSFPANSPEELRKRRAKKRGAWLSTLKSNPGIGRTQTLLRNYATYQWLRKYDKAWLLKHLPEKQKRSQANRVIDAVVRDVEYSALVREAAKSIRARPGRPVKVSPTAISRHLNKSAFANRRALAKLPFTQQAMSEVIESPDDISVRRIWWAAAMFENEGIQPTRTELTKRAAVGQVSHRTTVQQALDDALQGVL